MRVLGATIVAFVLLAAPAWSRSGPVQLGTALNSGGLNDPAYLSAVRRYDAVTPESALKFAELHPARDRYDFAFGDRMVDWARANRKPMHGTTLIWCDDQVLPSWLSSRSWTRAELLPIMRDHVTTVMNHFEGRVPAWDVVNEAFASNGSRRDCLWQRVIGDDWIEQALDAARDADPSARLFYNETAADFPNSKFGAVEAMAKDFRARGVPLDGIGLQNHVLSGSAPLQFLAEDAMRRIGALGLAVHVSELDAFVSQFGGTPQEALDRQAQAFQTIAAACQAVDACFRITVWGAADHWSWRGTEQKAVALDTAYREKPGWWGVQEAIRPAAVPAGVRPSPPGRPVASAGPNAGVFAVSWPAAWDADGDPLSYALEHRDADDPAWAAVASGIRSLGFSFVGGRLERQGTYRYRVRASDGQAAGGWSEESAAVIVDRTDPSPPAITPDRPPDGAGWHRDRHAHLRRRGRSGAARRQRRRRCRPRDRARAIDVRGHRFAHRHGDRARSRRQRLAERHGHREGRRGAAARGDGLPAAGARGDGRERPVDRDGRRLRPRRPRHRLPAALHRHAGHLHRHLRGRRRRRPPHHGNLHLRRRARAHARADPDAHAGADGLADRHTNGRADEHADRDAHRLAGGFADGLADGSAERHGDGLADGSAQWHGDDGACR